LLLWSRLIAILSEINQSGGTLERGEG